MNVVSFILGAAAGICAAGIMVGLATGPRLPTLRESRRTFRPSATGMRTEDTVRKGGDNDDDGSALYFYRTSRERFAMITPGPFELTGSTKVSALLFERQGGDGLWYNVEGYSIGGPHALVYDEAAPIEGRPLTEADTK